MSDIVLLDGGMGMELVRRSGREPTPLWSAQIMLEMPEIVTGLHRDFAEAGAEVLTLNSYAVTRPRLGYAGLGDLFHTLQRAAIETAETARREAATGSRHVRLAGCLPPLVASYRPELTLPMNEMLAQYREMVALQGPHVDVMICETMSSITEAVAATVAGAESGIETWCAVTVDDSNGSLLRSGERIETAVQAIRNAGAAAVLVNCSQPEAVNRALASVRPAPLPVGGYANGFAEMTTLGFDATVAGFKARKDLNPAEYADHVMAWINNGATIVGGCCEISPAHIAEIAGRLAAPVEQRRVRAV